MDTNNQNEKTIRINERTGATRPQCPACAVTARRQVGTKHGFELLSCIGCGTLYTSTLPAPDAGEYYNVYYCESNLSTPEFVERRLDEIVRGFAPYRQSNRLLDVGFGAGGLMQAAGRAGWQVLGAEVSTPAVEQAQRLGFEVFHGELAAAHYPDNSFDVVTAVEVFEHVPDPISLLREMARILRPGGLMWATTPHIGGLSGHLLKLQWSIVCPPEHLQLFSITGMKRALAMTGFRKRHIVAQGVNPYEIIQVLRPKPPAADNTGGGECSRVVDSYRLNEYMTGSSSRRILKEAANGVLSISRLGDSLKVWAVL